MRRNFATLWFRRDAVRRRVTNPHSHMDPISEPTTYGLRRYVDKTRGPHVGSWQWGNLRHWDNSRPLFYVQHSKTSSDLVSGTLGLPVQSHLADE
jgi:hypothetical protein